MVKLDFPRAVGVPDMTTELLVLGCNARPAGRLPEVRFQVNGPVAPPALTNAS